MPLQTRPFFRHWGLSLFLTKDAGRPVRRKKGLAPHQPARKKKRETTKPATIQSRPPSNATQFEKTKAQTKMGQFGLSLFCGTGASHL